MTPQGIPYTDAGTLPAFLALAALAALEFGLALLPVGRPLAVPLFLLLACAQAGVIARQFMHLKTEHLVISAMMLMPVILVILLVLTLVIDLPAGRTPR